MTQIPPGASRPIHGHRTPPVRAAEGKSAGSNDDLRSIMSAAIESWVNRCWLVLPGPADLAPELAKHIADRLAAAGWRPPAQMIETAEALAALRTGTVIRFRQGDIGSVDHGGVGEWTGNSTVVHFLDFVAGANRSTVGEIAGDFPARVLWTPENGDTDE